MAAHKPNYPIIQASEMDSRDPIRLIPEHQLDPIMQAELDNLRAGITYKFTVANTSENRENFNFKAIYFQMVAYKEGWEFNPDNLQVIYLQPGDPRFSEGESRIFEFDNKAANKDVGLAHRISPGNRLGFEVDKNSVQQMGPEKADSLGERVCKLFKK